MCWKGGRRSTTFRLRHPERGKDGWARVSFRAAETARNPVRVSASRTTAPDSSTVLRRFAATAARNDTLHHFFTTSERQRRTWGQRVARRPPTQVPRSRSGGHLNGVLLRTYGLRGESNGN